MKRALKKYFIPHEENNYHPHILHTKRAVFYGAVSLVLKMVVVLFVLALPARVFVLPDVLAMEQKKILAFTNELRAQKGLEPFTEVSKLDLSAQNKADDMAKYSYFSHTNEENKTVSNWVKETGYSYRFAGENLAMGFSTARDVVNAWVKSPTHYANLIDTDFLEFGAGLQSGEYNGVPTVFVAEHFASPAKIAVASVKTTPAEIARTKEPEVKTVARAEEPVIQPETIVLAEKEIAVAKEPVVFDSASSRVYWLEDDKKTNLSVRAKISGPAESAVVIVNSYPIELRAVGDNNFEGELLVNEPADNFFRVIISPVIRITGEDGQITESVIDWYNVKVVSPSPWQTYSQAKDKLPVITNIFSVSRGIYLAVIIFFALALLLNIFIEIRKQHYHIILQTFALLGLLTALFLF